MLPKWSSDRTRRDNLIFPVMKCRSESVRLSYLPKSIGLWNLLPYNVRSSESVQIFKKCLQDHMGTELWIEGLDRNQKKTIMRIRVKNCNLNAYKLIIGQSVKPFCNKCGE